MGHTQPDRSRFTGRWARLKRAAHTVPAYVAHSQSLMAAPGLAMLGLHMAELGGSLFHFKRRTLTVRPRELGGRSVCLDLSNPSHLSIFNEFVLAGAYDLSPVAFVPDCVIDCGAHIGLFTLLASSRFPAAHRVCFEPNPRNVKNLRRNMEINRLSVELHEKAVSTAAGKARFSGTVDEGGRLGDAKPGKSTHAFCVDVEVMDFPAWLKKQKFQSLLMKMDIEGEEEKLIPAILPLLPKRTVLFYETHGGEESAQRCAGLLEDQGFSVRCSRPRWPYCDGIAVRGG